MKRIPILGLVLLTAISLSACGSNSNKTSTSALSKAKTDVDSLFANSAHNKLLDGTTLDSINSTAKEVANLKDSVSKNKLKKDTETAKSLYPTFKKENTRKESISASKAESSEKVAESKAAQKASSTSKAAAVAKSSSEKAMASKSRENVKAILSEMTKEQYLNIESNVLERMKFDDIQNPGDQHGLVRFHSSLDNLERLEKEPNATLRDQKEYLTDTDYSNLKKYNKFLRDYLSNLHDYAVTYQSNMPVINDSDTSQEIRSSSQEELDTAESSYNSAKSEWLSQYSAITQQYSV